MKAHTGLVLLILFTGSGCRSDGFSLFPRTRAHVVGAVAEVGSTGTYAFVDFEKIKIDGKPLSGKPKLRAGEVLEVRHSSQRAVTVDVERVVVSGRTYDYTVLLGAGLGTGSVGQLYVTSSDPPTVVVDSGWVFMWGIRPRFQGRWVEAMTYSTTIALQLADSPVYVERVFLVSGGPADLICPGGSPRATLAVPGTFVEVTGGGTGACTISAPLPTTPALESGFLTPAKNHALAAGWTP